MVTNAGSGSGSGVFLMNDLNCRGDEQRVNDCDFAGWGRSDCTDAEVRGGAATVPRPRRGEGGSDCTEAEVR